MNFYRIEIARPELPSTILIVRASKAPTIKIVMERLSLDETAEIRIFPATVVTWEF